MNGETEAKEAPFTMRVGVNLINETGFEIYIKSIQVVASSEGDPIMQIVICRPPGIFGRWRARVKGWFKQKPVLVPQTDTCFDGKHLW